MDSVHYILHTEEEKTSHFTLYLVLCTFYLESYALYLVSCTLYRVHCTLPNVDCTFYGFCLFGGNALLPSQKCPPISSDKMPFFKMPFLKGHFYKSILSRNIEGHFWKIKRAFHICSLEMPSYNTWQNALFHNALFEKGIFNKSIL